MCLMRFKPKAEYVQGKEPVVADTLSRNPLSVLPETSYTEEEARAYMDTAGMVRPVLAETMESIKSVTSSDPQLSHLIA